MDHRYSKTATALPLTDGDVSWCALVVTLQEVHIHAVKGKSHRTEVFLQSILWVVTIFANANASFWKALN